MAPPPRKTDVAHSALARGSVFVHLDPRRDGVIVPQWLAQQPQLILQLGLDLAIPIPDLSIDDDGLAATLSFNRSPFACKIPWHSVFALVDDDGVGVVWPEDLPPEIAAEVERASRAPAKRPALRAVDGAKTSASPPADEAKPRPTHLRRVK